MPQIIHANQYDKGQTWIFNLRVNDQAFNVPSGASVTIQGTKADHTGFQYACSFSGSTATAIEQQQMTILSGDVPAEIVITKDNARIASANFIIRVEAAALTDDTVISETDLPLLEEAIEAALLALGYSQDAESYAVGTKGGTAVPSTDPAYHNNAKYYAENFVGYVTDAQYSAIQTLLS